MDNATNNSTAAPHHDDYDTDTDVFIIAKGIFRDFEIGLHVIDILAFIIGGTLNTYLLASILTCTQLRSKFRNHTICNIAILHLLDILVDNIQKFIWSHKILYVGFRSYSSLCQTVYIARITWLSIETIEDILLAQLTISFLLQSLDVDLWQKLNKLQATKIKMAVQIAPWLVSAIVTTSVVVAEDRQCTAFYENEDNIQIAFTSAPLCLAVVVVGAGFALQQSRLRRGGVRSAGDPLNVQLVGGGREPDNVYAYVAAIVIAVGTNMPEIISSHNLVDWNTLSVEAAMKTFFMLHSMEELRVVLMVFPWLFFTDIRERIRVWRPWRRQVEPAEIYSTVAYTRRQVNA